MAPSQPQPSDAQTDWDLIMVATARGHPWDPFQLVSLGLAEGQETWEIASQNDRCPQGLPPPDLLIPGGNLLHDRARVLYHTVASSPPVFPTFT